MTQISGLWRRLGYMQFIYVCMQTLEYNVIHGLQGLRKPLIYLEAQGQPFTHGKSPFTQPVVEKLDDFQPENKWEMVGQITISIHFKLVVRGSRYFWLMNCMTISLCPTERPGSIWVLPGKDEFARSGWVFGSCEVVGSGTIGNQGNCWDCCWFLMTELFAAKMTPTTRYTFLFDLFFLLTDWLESVKSSSGADHLPQWCMVFLINWCGRFEPTARHDVETPAFNPKVIKSVIVLPEQSQISMALHLETKHCMPFVLIWPRHSWLEAALFALYQDSGAKTTSSTADGLQMHQTWYRSWWFYRQRKKLHSFLPSRSGNVRELPTFLCSRVSWILGLKTSQELPLYKQVQYWGTFMKHWQMIPIFLWPKR